MATVNIPGTTTTREIIDRNNFFPIRFSRIGLFADSELCLVKLDLPIIYPITDTRLSGISHAEQVDKLVAGGANFIQLREKYDSPRDFYESAEKAISLARKNNARIIINDRVDIALALKADGVHLGQDDLPPEKAREILGENAIIGFSTHTTEQARQAISRPVDYIAIGPIFETQTKEKPDAPIGLKDLREVRKAIGDFPLVAIGGINAKNLRSVFDAGADSVAMIGTLISDSSNIAQRMDELVRLCKPI